MGGDGHGADGLASSLRNTTSKPLQAIAACAPAAQQPSSSVANSLWTAPAGSAPTRAIEAPLPVRAKLVTTPPPPHPPKAPSPPGRKVAATPGPARRQGCLPHEHVWERDQSNPYLVSPTRDTKNEHDREEASTQYPSAGSTFLSIPMDPSYHIVHSMHVRTHPSMPYLRYR